jgi:hypothetical protein
MRNYTICVPVEDHLLNELEVLGTEEEPVLPVLVIVMRDLLEQWARHVNLQVLRSQLVLGLLLNLLSFGFFLDELAIVS